MLKRVVYGVGTRPELIRSAQICRLLDSDPDIKVTLLATGQHYDEDMWDIFMRELQVDVETISLAVRQSDPARQIAEILTGASQVLTDMQPRAVCVFGDTNSSLSLALAALKTGIDLVHIEAGCRSFDFRMQEEHNRRVIDHIAGLLLCLSPAALKNLQREQVPGRVVRIGDPQMDEFQRTSKALDAPDQDGDLPRGFLTLHRAENVDDPNHLLSILSVVADVGQIFGLRWTFPVHPRTRKNLPATLPGVIDLVSPLSYRETLLALRNSRICVTDSGGLQKDAYWSSVPTVTVRPSTEWIETLAGGRNRLVTHPIQLFDAVSSVLRDPPRFSSADGSPYGTGRGAEEAVLAISEWLDQGESL